MGKLTRLSSHTHTHTLFCTAAFVSATSKRHLLSPLPLLLSVFSPPPPRTWFSRSMRAISARRKRTFMDPLLTVRGSRQWSADGAARTIVCMRDSSNRFSCST